MSAVVMVADVWKPSIVQIVPFSNSRIKRSKSCRETSPAVQGKRCFPILAVTRSQSGNSEDDSILTVDNLSSLSFSDYKSEVSESIPYSRRSSTVSFVRDKPFRKSARHSSMRENCSEVMVKFAVQDLNEQSGAMTPRRNSISSIDTGVSLSTVSASGSVLSNGLPKPTLSDKKYLYRKNGVKKSASFTPGEIDLQKHKDQYAKEQAQKRKKYKLNINQLPRSNTPINDHDPDKLNMKQVIRFLQKQKPSSSPRPETYNSKSPERQLSENAPKTAPTNYSVGETIRSDLKTSDSVRSRANEINIASRSKLMSRDSEAPSRASTLNTRYHLSRGQLGSHSHKNENGSSSVAHSEKRDKNKTSVPEERQDKRGKSNDYHYKNYERTRHSRKRVKEFKLHRFIALAPNMEGQKTNPLIISNLAKSRTSDWNAMREGLKSEGGNKVRSKSEERIPGRRVSSERPLPSHYRKSNKENSSSKNDSVTESSGDAVVGGSITQTDKYNIGKAATLMHQRALRFQKFNHKDDVSVCDSDDGKMSQSNASMIRLPSVHDYFEEEDEDTVHDSSKSDLEVKSMTHSSDNDVERKRETSISRTSLDSARSSVCMPSLTSSRLSFSSKTKSIHVNIPKEEEEIKEIRLSLRQEKDLTAQRSYMHDIATSRSSEPWAMLYKHTNGQIVASSGDSPSDNNLFKISTVSMQSRKNADLYNSTKVTQDNVTPRSIGALSIS